MRKTLLSILVIASCAAYLGATPLTVSWVEGKVEKSAGSGWAAINIGDRIDSAETVRLGAQATAEFTDGKRKVAIAAAGTFNLERLLRGGSESAKKRTAVVDKMGKMVDSSIGSGQTSVAGVRGAAVVEPSAEAISWASEGVDVDALMTEAKELAKAGKYPDAAAKFAAAAREAEGEQKDGALYGQAWALAVDGSAIPALKTLRSMPSSGPWAGPRALLLARLDLDSGAAEEAAAVLKAALAAKLLVGDDVELAKDMLAEAGI
jgi:hypothetical protein